MYRDLIALDLIVQDLIVQDLIVHDLIIADRVGRDGEVGEGGTVGRLGRVKIRKCSKLQPDWTTSIDSTRTDKQTGMQAKYKSNNKKEHLCITYNCYFFLICRGVGPEYKSSFSYNRYTKVMYPNRKELHSCTPL